MRSRLSLICNSRLYGFVGVELLAECQRPMFNLVRRRIVVAVDQLFQCGFLRGAGDDPRLDQLDGGLEVLKAIVPSLSKLILTRSLVQLGNSGC